MQTFLVILKTGVSVKVKAEKISRKNVEKKHPFENEDNLIDMDVLINESDIAAIIPAERIVPKE